MICPHKTTLLLAYPGASRELLGASRELLGASRELLVLNFAVWTKKQGKKTHDDATLNPEVLLLEQPDLDARFLQEPNQFTNPDHRKIRRYEHRNRTELQSTYALEETEDEVLPPCTPTKDSPTTASNIGRAD
jgi:hypothetical protein